MQVDVILGRHRIQIEREVFVSLIENSIVSSRAAYRRALDAGEIDYADLVTLARAADVPHPLFFAKLDVVRAQLAIKSEKLLGGLTKTHFSLNSRETVAIRDIELILKDLIRKQQLLKQHEPALPKNQVVGVLAGPKRSVVADAAFLQELLGVTSDMIRTAPTKEAALERLLRQVEANQILVARSQNNFMPQRIAGLKFSGITVKDPKVPYIFLPSGDEGERLLPAGRATFTLMLLTVLVARGIFAPVQYDSTVDTVTEQYEYDLTAEILMPAAEVRERRPQTLDEVEELADHFKVTPSAVLVRSRRLGLMERSAADAHLRTLRAEFAQLEKPRRNTSKAINAVRKYNGLEFSRRMIAVLDRGGITERQFCIQVCGGRLKPADLVAFRQGLR